MDPIVGRGKYTYKVDENWQRPPEWLDVKACAVSSDSEDRVYCINRNEAHPIVIFDRDGNFVGSWGDGPVNRSCHGIWCDGRRDLYVVQPGEWGRTRRIVKYHRR